MADVPAPDARMRGLGALAAWSLACFDGQLVVEHPSGARRSLPLAGPAGAVVSITLVRVPVWPVWWLGWGPAWWCDLVFADDDGTTLLRIPAGGGWCEDARTATRFALGVYPRTERLPRLVPGWSRAALEAMLRDTLIRIEEHQEKSGIRLVTNLRHPNTVWQSGPRDFS